MLCFQSNWYPQNLNGVVRELGGGGAGDTGFVRHTKREQRQMMIIFLPVSICTETGGAARRDVKQKGRVNEGNVVGDMQTRAAAALKWRRKTNEMYLKADSSRDIAFAICFFFCFFFLMSAGPWMAHPCPRCLHSPRCNPVNETSVKMVPLNSICGSRAGRRRRAAHEEKWVSRARRTEVAARTCEGLEKKNLCVQALWVVEIITFSAVTYRTYVTCYTRRLLCSKNRPWMPLFTRRWLTGTPFSVSHPTGSGQFGPQLCQTRLWGDRAEPAHRISASPSLNDWRENDGIRRVILCSVNLCHLWRMWLWLINKQNLPLET